MKHFNFLHKADKMNIFNTLEYNDDTRKEASSDVWDRKEARSDIGDERKSEVMSEIERRPVVMSKMERRPELMSARPVVIRNANRKERMYTW